MKNRFLFFIFSIMLFFGGCEEKATYFENLKQLEGGKTFAVPTGTAADQFVLKRFPDAELVYYNTVLDCALAVKGRKADAAVYDKPVLKNIAAKNEGLNVLDDLLLPDSYGFAVDKKNTSLKAAMDEVLIKLKADGTYNEMLERWFPEKGGPAPMPEIPLEGTEGVLVFGTSAFTEPMTYFSADQKIIGFDIEFAQRIAKHLNKKLEIVNMEFGAMLPALISGKVEMIGAGLSITEERAKSVLFSESYYESGLAALVNLPPQSSVTHASAAENPEEQWTEIGVLMGSIHEGYALKKYPEKKVLSYNSVPDMLMALNSGKVQAAFMDHTSVREVLSVNQNFDLLQSNIFSVDIAAGFNKKSTELREAFNHFLAEIKADGTYDAMVKRWHEEVGASMPEIPNPNPVGAINIGIVSDIGLPFAAKSEGQWRGFDVELGSRFGAWSGKAVNWIDMPFGSLLPSLVSEKIDIITASLMITEERQKQIDFSDPYYASGVSLIGMKDATEQATSNKMKVLEDIANKKVGIFTGTVHDAFMEKKFPRAEVFRFERTADMLLSLKSGKIDAAMFDLSTAGIVLKRNPEMGMLSSDVLDMPLGIGFNKKNTPLLNEFNDFLKEIKQDGTYETMHERWFVNDPEVAVMPDFVKPASGKKLVAGVSVEDLPYVAMMNGKYVGFDIELIQAFAMRHNYALEITTIEFAALVAALSSGKVDLITDGIAISEERAKQINFSDPYAIFRTAVIAPKSKLAKYGDEKVETVSVPFFQRMSESFYNNIILEKRYLMILRGLSVTIIISVLAAIAGTLLGGLICFMRMSKNKFLKIFASYFISLIRGTPVLVFLMIIYYVVFASVNINPVIVAVIAFGINFAAYVSEMFRSSIESIDKGQNEAGIASGFTKIQTFIHIIMPQAMQRVLPVYKGEFISLVKMTSIVGYIAVEDLTKASDIIRSRTFDAFFPLIMAAVIYIIIAWLLTLVLNYAEFSVDPKKRRLSLRKVAKQ